MSSIPHSNAWQLLVHHSSTVHFGIILRNRIQNSVRKLRQSYISRIRKGYLLAWRLNSENQYFSSWLSVVIGAEQQVSCFLLNPVTHGYMSPFGVSGLLPPIGYTGKSFYTLPDGVLTFKAGEKCIYCQIEHTLKPLKLVEKQFIVGQYIMLSLYCLWNYI